MLCGTHLRKLYTFLRKARGDDSRKPRAKPASAAVVSPSPDGGTNKQLHNDALLRPPPLLPSRRSPLLLAPSPHIEAVRKRRRRGAAASGVGGRPGRRRGRR